MGPRRAHEQQHADQQRRTGQPRDDSGGTAHLLLLHRAAPNFNAERQGTTGEDSRGRVRGAAGEDSRGRVRGAARPALLSCRRPSSRSLGRGERRNDMTDPRRIAIGAPHILAFDGRGHRMLRDGVVVIEGDSILHVGPRFDGPVDETVNAADRIVTPGLISTHAHIAGSPLDRSFIEDRGNPQFWYSGLFEMLPVRGGAQDEQAGRACVDFSMAEMLRGGVTTVMEIGGLGQYVVERAAHYGLRVYMGLAFRSGRWLTKDGRRVIWEWDDTAGRKGLERALDFLDKHDGA